MPVKPTIVLDLDGTLIDNSVRHFEVYKFLSSNLGITNILKQKEYWDLRRGGLSNIQVMLYRGMAPSLRNLVFARWMEMIENDEMLRRDNHFPGVKEWLWNAEKLFNLYLITLRKNITLVNDQIDRMGIMSFFRKVICVSHDRDPATSKAKAFDMQARKKIEVWIGDSEVDLQAAQIIGTKFIAVSSGVRDEKWLRSAGATEIYRFITEIDLETLIL
ncbi:HAD family hydrolase [Thermodesulfobacteriota bacterium]